MSIQAVAWVLEASESRGFARLTLIALANHANDRGTCWPAQRTIAQEAGVSPGSIPPQIDKLLALGEIEIAEPGGPRRATRYRLPFADLRSAGEHNECSGAERSARLGLSAARGPGLSRTVMNHQEPSEALRERKAIFDEAKIDEDTHRAAMATARAAHARPPTE